MTLSIGAKGNRVLTFIAAIRDPEIAARLAEAGYDQAVAEEGWALVHTHADARLGIRALLSSDDLELLDALENRSFPIVKAALARHFPEVHDEVFLNLPRASGRDLIVTVKLFIERIEVAYGGPDGGAVAELLATRGFTSDVVAEAKSLLARLTTLAETSDGVQVAVDLEATEAAMWAWYLEWSAIARALIDARGQLRRLGFLQSATRPGTLDELESVLSEPVEDDVVEDAVA
jgi:hypothetical protein